MHMPEMDGSTLAARMRARAPRCRSCCSARSAGAKRRPIAVRATLGKPIHQSQLFDTLATLLATRGAAKPAPATQAQLDAGMAPATRCASCSPRTTS
jgi:CheY-like chemotaxis protein